MDRLPKNFFVTNETFLPDGDEIGLATTNTNTNKLKKEMSDDFNCMNFKEEDKASLLLDQLQKMQTKEKLCDVTLYVQGKVFYAHKIILSATSPYFESMFSINSTRKEVLSISSQQPEIFQKFLTYLYSGKISINKENVSELIRLANHFYVLKLKNYCAQFLEKHLNTENCLSIKELGDKFKLPNLSQSATIFIQSNLGEVINHEIIMELGAKQLYNFVTNSKGWNIPQEASLKLMSRWVNHNIGPREKDFKQLLKIIHWSQIESEVIFNYVDQEPLYGSSERCFYYILHSLSKNNIHIEKYEQIYQALHQRFGEEPDQPLGYNENLIQMAFNAASSASLPTTGGNDIINQKAFEQKKQETSAGDEKEKSKKRISIEKRRKLILEQIQKNRSKKRIAIIRVANGKRKRKAGLTNNALPVDSSGDEECDPIQTGKGYRCHLCPLTTNKVSRLERHLSTVHAHDVTYRCSECDFSCKWNREYFLHMKTHYEGPPYKCSLCQFTCQKIGSLIAHKVSHLNLRTYECSMCHLKSRNKANLEAHLKTHAEEIPTFRCNICGQNFTTKVALDEHATGHIPDKLYSCSLCSFTTKYLTHFSNHKKTQHGSGKKGKGELYRCNESQCTYTTYKKSQLDSHIRSHSGIRPHVCSICGRRFLEKSHLVRHERIHYNERPFKCEECDYASTRRDKLKEHKTRHHGANGDFNSVLLTSGSFSKESMSMSESDECQISLVSVRTIQSEEELINLGLDHRFCNCDNHNNHNQPMNEDQEHLDDNDNPLVEYNHNPDPNNDEDDLFYGTVLLLIRLFIDFIFHWVEFGYPYVYP